MRRIRSFPAALALAAGVLTPCATALHAQEVGAGLTGGWTDLPALHRALGLTAWVRGATWSVRYDYMRHREDHRPECADASPSACDALETDVTGRMHSLMLGRPVRVLWRPSAGVLLTPEAGIVLAGVTRDSVATGRELSGIGPLAGVGGAAEVQFRVSKSVPFRFLVAARQRFTFPLGSADPAKFQEWRDLSRVTLWEFGLRYEKEPPGS